MIYTGPTEFKKMTKDARTAYQSWLDQRYRCNNKKSSSFKYYGAKGVKVEYSSREFVGWWLVEQEKLRLKKPTISRIDHGKNYCFDNVILEEFMDNCVSETLKRHGPPGVKRRKKVAMYAYPKMTLMKIFSSGVEASEKTGVKRANICSLIRGKSPNGRRYLKTKDGFTFRYYEENSKTSDKHGEMGL